MKILHVQQAYFIVGDDGRRLRVPALRHRPAEEQPLPHLGGQHGALLVDPVISRFTLIFLGNPLHIFDFARTVLLFSFFIPTRAIGTLSRSRVDYCCC